MQADVSMRGAREAIDRAIAEGYEWLPPTQVEDEWAAASARDAVREEPW